MTKILHTMLLATLAVFAVVAYASGVPEDELEEYGTGIIQNYTDMEEGEDIDWLWVAPEIHLANYRYSVQSVKNLTTIADKDLMDVLNSNLGEQLALAGSHDDGAPTLNVEVAVYWAERANRSKRWIPFAGMHLAQAGAGIELLFKDQDGKLVAKIRHSAREGNELVYAGQELSDDLAGFVRAHRSD